MMYRRIFLVHLKTVLLTAKHTKVIAIAMMPVCLLTWSDYCGHLYKTPIKAGKDEFTVRFGLVWLVVFYIPSTVIGRHRIA